MLDTEEIERKAKLNGGWDAFPNQDGGGLTKREWFAGMALQGIVSACGCGDGVVSYTENSLAINAIAAADELLKQLAESDGAK
jgi:hypothetical protein